MEVLPAALANMPTACAGENRLLSVDLPNWSKGFGPRLSMARSSPLLFNCYSERNVWSHFSDFRDACRRECGDSRGHPLRNG